TPSLFAGLAARDETSWCVELGDKAEKILKRHWDSFVSPDDFAWLSAIGINAVRIPIGHWLFGPDYPFHPSYGDCRHPYVEGGIDVLDKAFDLAEQNGLSVVLDLHAAPGCQNGFDNGGIQDVCEWHTREEYIAYAVEFLGRLAERYGNHPALHGIEVLNEPRWDIATEVLKRYNLAACQAIRKHCSEKIAVVFHDGFRGFRDYGGFMASPECRNVILDIHRYQCFVEDDIGLELFGHLQKVLVDWTVEATDIVSHAGMPTYVGEWSLGLDSNSMRNWGRRSFGNQHAALDDFQSTLIYRAYAAAQLACFEKYRGWFFWSYKTESTPCWSFRDCVERGWLPSHY
ncbi:MAG: glycoside hydrolase family 5 protein, partial [Methylomonas sp.]|nr:glycoside hydrolase family 5 protein [Methylomonas sp.]